MRTYSLTIKGTPEPKGRPRFMNGHAVTPEKTRRYERMVRALWLSEHKECLFGDVAVRLEFYMPIPTSWSKRKQGQARAGAIRPAVRPDIDNLVKAVLDGLNETAYTDDKQIISLMAEKYYSDEPRTEVLIMEVEH